MSTAGGQLILAIDLGTSAVKLAAITLRGAIVASQVEPTQLSLLPHGGAEQDPEDWWSAIVRGTRRMLERGTVAASDFVGVNCSAQWAGTVAVDEQGRPLRPAIIWMDSRGASHVRRAVNGFPHVEGYGLRKLITWIRLTGGAPSMSGKDAVGHILFLQESFPDVYRNTYKFLEPKDWLNLKLTGRFAASYDSINVHWVTDNRDLAHVRYDERLLRLSGLPRDKLPELVPPATVLGPLNAEAARALGLGEHVQVVTGSPDILAGAVGSGAVRDFEAHLCIGTSAWLSCHVPFKKTDLLHQMGTMPSALPGRYLLVNEQDSAGVCLSSLKNLLFDAQDTAPRVSSSDVFETMEREAARVPAGSDQLIFMPWLNGERSPVEDRLTGGGFFNQTLQTTRGHLIRAVLEGVAYNARWLLKYVEPMIGRKLDGIRLIGGGGRSKLWCQILADVLNRPIHQVDEPVMANARGAAFQAGLALGHLTVSEIPALVPIARSYTPDPNHRGLYDELFGEFLNLYKNNKAIFARLNRARGS